MNKDVVLISGLGPGRLDQEDLIGTCFDKSLNNNCKYFINGKNYDALNLEVEFNGNRYPLLKKKKKRSIPTLVNNTLEQILTSANIEYDSFDTSVIWDNEAFKPKQYYKIVCLSTTFMWSEDIFEQTIKWINCNITYEKLLVGGKYSSLKKSTLLDKYESIDYIIVGDGEEALPRLINYLLGKKEDFELIPNIIYRTNGNIKSAPFREINIESLPISVPKRDQKIVMYESVRGCVHKCKFCAWSSGVERFRYKSGEKIYNEWLSYINEYGIEEIQVIDSTFLFPNCRTEYLLSRLERNPIRWKANSRTDIPVTEDYVKRLEKSGCVSLKFGFESMCEKTLKNMNKCTTPNQNRLVNSYFKNSEIDTICSFIIGFPGETTKDFEQTKEYLKNEHYGHFHLYVFSMEDECMPIWKDKDKFNIHILDNFDTSFFHQDGRAWEHIGMNSTQAEQLRQKALQEIRLCSETAIHRSWQTQYYIDFKMKLNRSDHICLEKLIERYVFVPVDYKTPKERAEVFEKILFKLKRFGISLKKEN